MVEVVDDDGVSGCGEAPQVWQVTGESLAGAEACVSGPLTDVVRGRAVDDLARPGVPSSLDAVVGNYGAKAAVDVALHDLAARRRGHQPARVPRRPTGAQRVPTDVTLSAGEPDELAATARKRVADGFTVLKLKVGTDAADRRRPGPRRPRGRAGARIRLDANQGWTPDAGDRGDPRAGGRRPRRRVRRAAGRAPDLDGLAWVTAAVDTPVMADESVFGVRDLVEVIRRRAADLVNVKLAKCGGLGAARDLLELARAARHGHHRRLDDGEPDRRRRRGHPGRRRRHQPRQRPRRRLVAGASPVVGGATYDAGVIVLPGTPGLGIEGLR